MSDGEYIEGEEEFVDELKPGTELMLGQYTIDSFLAAGGFGITYLAKDSLDRYVVIKECFPGSFCRRQNHSVLPRSRAHQNELKSIVRMFSQEAMSLSKAGHPNIVGVHQVFEENNTAYMALDYVKGNDLLEILNEAPERLTPELVQGYLTKVLSAIGHVHNQGILHRDISPDNIIISETGEPVLIDFGAAREEAGGKASRLLSALRVVKDGYSPQEFYIAGSEQGPSCDLYSLAASFYHVITGDLPPDSQVRLTAFAANEPDPYVPLASVGDGYPQEFCTALDKAMSVLPRDRMQSAEEWVAHLSGEITAEPVQKAAQQSAGTSQKKEGKSLMPVLLGGAAVAAAAGVGFVMMSAPNGDAGDQVTEVVAPELTSPEETKLAEADPIESDLVDSEPVEEDVVADAAPVADEPVETEDIAKVDVPEDTSADVADASDETEEPVIDTAATEDEPEVVEDEAEAIAGLSIPGTPPVARPERPGPSNIIVQTEADELPADAIAGQVSEPVLPASFEPTELSRELVTLASVNQDNFPSIDLEAPAALPAPEPEPEPEPQVAEVEDQPSEQDATSSLLAASNWSVRMPFAPSAADASVVGEVYLAAWGWLQEGTEISGVNGISINDINMIPGVLRQSSVVTDQTQLEVLLSAGFGNSAVEEHAIILPVIQETTLNNGIRFETAFRNGVWQTVVTDTADANTTLQPGDLVIEHLGSNTGITSRTALADAISATDTDELSLLVSRDGSVVEAGLIQQAPQAVADAAPTEDSSTNVDVILASPVVEREVSGVPFTLDPNKPLAVGTVGDNAPFWIVPGLEIATINGTVVTSNDEIMSLINSSGGIVQVGVKALFTSALIERPLRVGKQTETILLNGLTFVTQVIDGESITQVSSVPAGSNFLVGDTLVAYVGTSERLDGTISVKDLLERELNAGKTTFSFAVDRQGEVWVEAFNLASLAE